jgi:hypothetical protein
MKKLDESFRRNGLQYTLIKRNEYVALYGIGGTYTDKILNYEVARIKIRNDDYEIREHVAANCDFGNERSRCYNNMDRALKYYDELTTTLRKDKKLPKGVLKTPEGVEQNEKVIPEYQLG